MRRGYLLMELLVSIALLAVVIAVATRLLFTSDRALAAEGEHIAAVGGAADLISDLGRDLRGAHSVSGGDVSLMIAGSPAIRYDYSRERGAVMRYVVGNPDLTREYPGLRVRFAVRGDLVTVDLSTSAGEMRTGFYLRN